MIAECGLVEGTCNTHPGQGTANRRFFAANSTLELLYVSDPDEALQAPVSGLGFVDRSKQQGASPFGLVLKRKVEQGAVSFPGWNYHPDYFEDEHYFRVGENSNNLQEPLCILMPPGLFRPDLDASVSNPDWSLSQVIVSVPRQKASAILLMLAKLDIIDLRLNRPHQLELVFNQGKLGKVLSLAPHSPVLIKW